MKVTEIGKTYLVFDTMFITRVSNLPPKHLTDELDLKNYKQRHTKTGLKKEYEQILINWLVSN